MNRVHQCSIVLGLALAVAACTGDDAAPAESTTAVSATAASTTTIDPTTLRGYPRVCLMIDLAVVDELTGAQTASSEEAVFRGVTNCFVRDAAGEKIVALAAGPADEFADVVAAADAVPVTGLGDDAVRSDGALHVLMGTEHLKFTLYPAAGVDAANADAVIDGIAADVLSRYTPPLDDAD